VAHFTIDRARKPAKNRASRCGNDLALLALGAHVQGADRAPLATTNPVGGRDVGRITSQREGGPTPFPPCSEGRLMPLLLCPNDNSSMQTVDRAGVQFDMCPTCRGVWLDRGELEKLMEAGAQSAAPPAAAPRPAAAPPPQAAQQPWNAAYGERGERGEYGERGERGEYGHGHGGYRKRRGSIFDIFD